MSTEIRVPQLPESVADATLVTWHKQPGDPIRRDENLADLETDKVVLEVPAPSNGVVRELRVPSGTVVTSGQVLAVIEDGKVAEASAPPPATVPAAAPARAAAAVAATEAAGRLSPSVRRLVEENHLDPAAIPGSGRDGRLTKADVVDYLGRKPAVTTATAVASAATTTPASAVTPIARAPAARPTAPPAPASGARAEQRV